MDVLFSSRQKKMAVKNICVWPWKVHAILLYGVTTRLGLRLNQNIIKISTRRNK